MPIRCFRWAVGRFHAASQATGHCPTSASAAGDATSDPEGLQVATSWHTIPPGRWSGGHSRASRSWSWEVQRRTIRRPASRRLRRRRHYDRAGSSMVTRCATGASFVTATACGGRASAATSDRCASTCGRRPARTSCVKSQQAPTSSSRTFGLAASPSGDYAGLSPASPALIMAHVSGYGATGPRVGAAGFGSIGQAVRGPALHDGHPGPAAQPVRRQHG